jgi:UPF0755 protein
MKNMATKQKKKSPLGLIIRTIVVALVLSLGFAGYQAWKAYQKVYEPNVVVEQKQTGIIYIPTGSDFSDVKEILYEKGYITDVGSFEWVAEKKKYTNSVKPGKYELRDGMSNNELVNMLRAGNQVPVKVTFIATRSIEYMAGRAARNIEADSAEIMALLSDPAITGKYGFTKQTIMAMFLPNTYEFTWNTSAREFLDRMHQVYKQYWDEVNRAKADKMGMTPLKVSILASIVEQELAHYDEAPMIAGVYINRLEKGIPLQADPTLKFAAGDWSIRRVLNRHREIESPYNTYKHRGLPPGPICIPSKASIDAVLGYDKHDYLFFCAKPDGSGYHAFAKTNAQHQRNARSFQRWLDSRGIYK